MTGIRGAALAAALEMHPPPTSDDFQDVWLQYLAALADSLVSICRFGHLEDLPWAKAETYIDHMVMPRVRFLRRVAPDCDSMSENRFGGILRFRRVLAGLTSPDPAVVERMAASWDVFRILYPDAPDPAGLEGWDDDEL